MGNPYPRTHRPEGLGSAVGRSVGRPDKCPPPRRRGSAFLFRTTGSHPPWRPHSYPSLTYSGRGLFDLLVTCWGRLGRQGRLSGDALHDASWHKHSQSATELGGVPALTPPPPHLGRQKTFSSPPWQTSSCLHRSLPGRNYLLRDKKRTMPAWSLRKSGEPRRHMPQGQAARYSHGIEIVTSLSMPLR